MLRKSYRNVRNSSRTKKIGERRVNRGFSGIREAPNAPDLGITADALSPQMPGVKILTSRRLVGAGTAVLIGWLSMPMYIFALCYGAHAKS
jgi:hypothetical protein